MGWFSEKQLFIGEVIWRLGAIATIGEVLLFKIVYIPILEKPFFHYLIGYPDFAYHASDFFTSGAWFRYLHLLPGAVVMLMIQFQLWSTFRHNHIDWHRWMGRVATLCAIVCACGLIGALRQPGYLYACTPVMRADDWASSETMDVSHIEFSDCPSQAEYTALLFTIPHFFVTLSLGILNIKRAQHAADLQERGRRITRHKVWMLRCSANMISPGVFRLVNIVWMPINLYAGPLARRYIFGWQIWAVWSMNFVITEIYIQTHILAADEKAANAKARGDGGLESKLLSQTAPQ